MLSTENKERILKTARKKWQITYIGKLIRVTADFSTETFKARRTRNEVSEALKISSNLDYSGKLPFIIEGEIKT
jgi:hypothetical protein